MNAFEIFQKEQNLKFKLEKLLKSNQDRSYHDPFFISVTREELEIIIKQFYKPLDIK